MQTSAHAATTGTLPKSLEQFAHCPISNPAVTACLYSSTGGTFQVGKASLTLSSPAILSLGLIGNADGSVTAVLPNDGTPGLVAPSTNIPTLGGLLNVGATPVLAGLPTLSIPNLVTGHGVAVSLPLAVNLSNFLLGSTCTLGTTAAPLTINLTDGKTNPPPPNMPESGTLPTLSSKQNGLVTITGGKLLDNAFPAPGASGCGPFGLFNGLVNVVESLPSPAGTNSAALSGTLQTAPAALIHKYLG